MNQHISLCSVLTVFYLNMYAQNQLPTVSSGSINRVENFNSAYVAPRHVDIWLPEGYSDAKSYDALYMHDGQMLFDPSTTWNGQAWNVDDVATALFINEKAREFIVVGIWNNGPTRHQDYFPQKPFEAMTPAERDTVNSHLVRAGRTTEYFQPDSDDYLKFIVTELKPYIDKNYSVRPGRESTYIGGSSMGGLVSIYALCEYPEIFGGAMCMSTHWPGIFTNENNPVPNALLSYLEKNLPPPGAQKIYFDLGDKTRDALYPPTQKKVDEIMAKKGYNERIWITMYFQGAEHNEAAWSQRLHIPITFILGK